MRLAIDKTWDGHAIPRAEQASVRLYLRPDALIVEVSAPFHRDPKPSAPVGPTWKLWEHEVVELFLVGENDRYTEIELGPHGHHLVLRLEGERNIVEQQLPIGFATRIDGTRWTGVARIPLAHLPARPWRGNAFAIHGVGGQRRYLVATALGTAQPDFHCISGFEALSVG
ncbi:MAG: hypothetical protein KC912_25270 [Proteobacteria bacterium]|nr:hypothetical protein [Pseudomonadota bacterium]